MGSLTHGMCMVFAKRFERSDQSFPPFLNSFSCFLLGSPVHVRWKLSNLEQLQLHGSVHEAADVADQSGKPNWGLGDQGEGPLGEQKAMAWVEERVSFERETGAPNVLNSPITWYVIPPCWQTSKRQINTLETRDRSRPLGFFLFFFKWPSSSAFQECPSVIFWNPREEFAKGVPEYPLMRLAIFSSLSNVVSFLYPLLLLSYGNKAWMGISRWGSSQSVWLVSWLSPMRKWDSLGAKNELPQSPPFSSAFTRFSFFGFLLRFLPFCVFFFRCIKIRKGDFSAAFQWVKGLRHGSKERGKDMHPVHTSRRRRDDSRPKHQQVE